MKQSAESSTAVTVNRPGQTAPFKVALAVAAASSVVMLVLAASLIWAVWRLSRISTAPEPTPHGRHRPRGWGRHWEGRIIDVTDVVPLLVALAIVSVILISLIAWLVTKRANAPLERALEVQQAFVADASHELRTPLTTLSGRIQLAQYRLNRGGDVGQALRDARTDAQLLDDVLTDLLTAAETAAVGTSKQYADVTEAATTAIHLTQTQAERAGVTVTSAIPQDMRARGGQTALARALVALLDNAIRHSQPNTTISITACNDEGFTEIRVIDQGQGITEPNPEVLFERFRRGGESSESGFGLGLALVREIATRSGGDVHIESTSPNGTTFLLRLPER